MEPLCNRAGAGAGAAIPEGPPCTSYASGLRNVRTGPKDLCTGPSTLTPCKRTLGKNNKKAVIMTPGLQN